MEKTKFEEAPVPPPEDQFCSEPTAEAPAAPTLSPATKLMNQRVSELAQALIGKLQANRGQFNVVEMQVQMHVLVQHIDTLTEMVCQLSGGALTDEIVTDAVAHRMSAAIEQVLAQPTMPQVTPPPPNIDIRKLRGGGLGRSN